MLGILCLALLLYNWDVQGSTVMVKTQATPEVNMTVGQQQEQEQQQHQQEPRIKMNGHHTRIQTGSSRARSDSQKDRTQYNGNIAGWPPPIVSSDLFNEIMFWSRDVLHNIVAFSGVLTNFLMIFSLATIDNRIESSVKTYFIFLAIFGIIMLTSQLCMNALSFMAGFTSYWYVTIAAYLQGYVQRVVKSSSIWLMAVICLQRLLVIFKPMSVREIFITRRPYSVVILILMLMCACMSANLVHSQKASDANIRSNFTLSQAIRAQFDSDQSEAMEIWAIIEYIIRQAIPMFLIFVFTVALIVKISMMRQERKRLTPSMELGSEMAPDQRKEQEHKLTITSLSVAVVTFICLIPVDVVYLIVKFRPDIFFPFEYHLYVSVMLCLSVLHSLHYFLCFFIFILSSTTFRTYLASKCCCIRTLPALHVIENNEQGPN